MPSVSEIAKKANVSKSTVSLALNDKPGISQKMRQHVLTVAHELNSAEKSAPLTKRAQHALSVLVLHPDILPSSHVFGELVRGIEAGAAKLNVQLRLASNGPALPDNHVTRLYLSQERLRPDGILVIGARVNEPLVQEARTLGIPCVIMGGISAERHVSIIRRDEVAIAERATHYLLELGHRAIAFLGGDRAYPFTNSRLSGYRNALTQHNVEVIQSRIALGDGVTAANALLANAPDVTAALFVNETYALDGLPVLMSAGRTIPDDLSIICFDDTPAAATFNPPLTTIGYHHFDEGFWMVKTLVEQIQHPILESKQVTFSAHFIERESCRRIKGADIRQLAHTHVKIETG